MEKEPSTSVKHEDGNLAPKKVKLSKRKKTEKSINMAVKLFNSEISGRKQQLRYKNLTESYVHRYQDRFKDVDEIPVKLYELFQMVKKKDFSIRDYDFKECLENIVGTIRNDQKCKKSCLEFHYIGGIELFADILCRSFYDFSKNIFEESEIVKVKPEDIRTVKSILQILYLCAQNLPIEFSHLCKNHRLLHLLFSLLAEEEKRTYTDAILLLEEMLLSQPREVNIDMKKIACLPAILNSDMPHLQEAHLYHILASIISVGDAMMGVDSSLQEHDRWLLDHSKSQLNKENQQYLLNFPNFLSKLFRTSCHQMGAVIQPEILQFVFHGFDIMDDVPPAMLRRYISMEGQQRTNPIYQAALYCEKSARADTFLLLSMLLTGSCREQMQENILKYDLVRNLEKSVDAVVWDSLSVPGLQDSLIDYGDGPEITVRVHYLRLIYSIADHHNHRYLLLNEKELAEIEEIAASDGLVLPDDFGTLDRSKCCKRETGLLTQIIEKLKGESSSSYIRFWMTRSLESFLRGASCTVDQTFLLQKGLLEELFGVLLSDNPKTSEVIQGHFDLLASLMKDNLQAFERFSKIVDSASAFNKLCHLVDNNLVDSNMFVRCVILSLHYLESFGGKYHDFIESSLLLKHYTPIKKRVEVIFNLVGLLNVKTLSQENVSCLNTSIIILIVADIWGHLPEYLAATLSFTQDIFHTGREILERLRELLAFWLEHYSHSFKENDIRSLEEVTGFKFGRWKDLVTVLIKNDRSSPLSILHYLSPETPGYALKATVAPSCVRTS